MFKFLTIIFFTYYLINLFKQNSIMRGAFKDYTEEIKAVIIKKNSTNLTKEDKTVPSSTIFGLFLLFYLLFQFIEFVYVIVALGHDPYKYPSFAYLVFWILILVKLAIGKKTFSPVNDLSKYSVEGAIDELDKFKDSLGKFNFKGLLQTLVDISFFTYMIYILFLL